MIKNKTETPYGAKGISSNKWLLLACAASAAAVDIIIIAMLLSGGEGGEYLACPFLLLIFDLFYFAVSLFFTNFRFKYSIGVWVSYIVLYTVGFSIGLAIILGGDGTVLTNGALALWGCVHAFSILCAVICALFASRLIKKMWVALAFAVVFIVGVVAYAGFMFAEGFFGQGKGNRTLVYSYDSAAGRYTVTGVLAGKSDTVTVPETFNGKPVTKVSLKVLADGSIKNYNLPSDIAFTDKGAIKTDMDLSGKRINVDKKAVNEIRQKFLAFTDTNVGNALALANATLPVNLTANEGYVAFNYCYDSFTAVGRNTIPVYVGDLNNFDAASYTAGYAYIEHREDGSGDNYHWAYSNGGYIFTDIKGADGSVFDGVTKSTVAEVVFEKVYRISVDNGNDSKYVLREKQPEMCFDTVGGQPFAYKYLTATTAADFLDELTPRAGFSSRWLCYINSPTVDGKYFTDLTEVLRDGVTISPRWELDKPTLTLSTTAADNAITYGEDVTIISNVQTESGFTPNYRWNFKDELQSGWHSQSVELIRPKASEYQGEYTLTVTIGGNEFTSLGAVAQASIELKINPKRIDMVWNLPENRVYDGTLKTVGVTYDESQNVEGDPLQYTVSGLQSFKNAGTYNISVIVDVITLMNYDVRNRTAGVTIEPCPVEVNWSNYENLEYNGYIQSPAATATGVATDGALSVSVSGGSKNAGNYTARATVSDTNYTATNPTRAYTIKPAPLEVTVGDATVVYGDSLRGSGKITYSGFVGGDGTSAVGGTARFYTVPAIGDEDYKVGTVQGGVRVSGLTSQNYTLTYTYGELTITPRTVNVSWNVPENLVYDGAPKNVTATVANKVAGDEVTLSVSGGNGITVDTYTATVTAIAGADAANYVLPENVTRQYEVTWRWATVVWHAPENPVYDGAEHEVAYYVQNLVEGDEQHFTGSFKYKDAGDYTFNVASDAADEYIRTNYNLVSVKLTLTVKPAKGAVEVFVNRIPYDDYDTAVRVGDTISWKGNSIVSVRKVTLDGKEVYPSNGEGGWGDGWQVSNTGEFTVEKAGDYVFVFDIESDGVNVTGNTVTFKMSGVLEREVQSNEN